MMNEFAIIGRLMYQAAAVLGPALAPLLYFVVFRRNRVSGITGRETKAHGA